MATGPISNLIEATAVSVGAGMVLGGFVASLLALVAGIESADRERAISAWSTLTGLGAAGVGIAEMVFR